MDGSRNSYKALSAALSLSKSVDSKVTVIHVTEYLPKPHFLSQKALEQLLQEQSNKGKKVLDKCLLHAKKISATIKTELQEGDPASVILNVSSAGKYDLIIMGNRGLGRFKRLLLGSVSTKVVNHASCSILLVRSK